MRQLVERLKCKSVRSTTAKTYLSVWRSFNKFLILLDRRPDSWEERTILFIANLIDRGAQSATITSYKSTIKNVLQNDGYIWDDKKVWLHSLTHACRLINDTVKTRLPIRGHLLEVLLFEIQRRYGTQPYLQIMYMTIFSLGYYGLMRIGELVKSEANHTVKAKDVRIALNKNKIQLVLYTSKSHGKANMPQKIKITAVANSKDFGIVRFFCPFKIIREFAEFRGGFESETEPFIVFRDGTQPDANSVRILLRSLLSDLHLDASLYDTQSFRIGRSTDMLKANCSLKFVKSMGR